MNTPLTALSFRCLSFFALQGQQQTPAGGRHVPGLDAPGAPVHGVVARPASRGCCRDGQAPGQVQHLQGVSHHWLQVGVAIPSQYSHFLFT